MLIYPAIDLYAGQAVRLQRGDYARMTVYSDRPETVAADFAAQGARQLHLIDLEGAKNGGTPNLETIVAVKKSSGLFCQVGGGIRSVDDIRRLLNVGADKVSVNTAAIHNPQLVADAARYYGSQCLVVAIDAKRQPEGGWHVYTHGGRNDTGLDALEWARRVADLGAGEILLTSMDRDGTRIGFDLELTRAVCDAVPIPVIASGGVGNLQHLVDGVTLGGADAVLAASIFHFGEHTIAEAKALMASQGVPVRLDATLAEA